MRIRLSRILFPLAVLVLLGGCTTLPQESVSQVDEQHVARVESAAARAGTKIYWMSKPLKSTAAPN